jgi:hypothetical protein
MIMQLCAHHPVFSCAVLRCAVPLQESALAQLSECQAQLAAAHQQLTAAEEELLTTHRQVGAWITVTSVCLCQHVTM